MREKLKHIVETEFIFYVCPEVNEDIKPLAVSGRDLLPGGLTRDEYNQRLDRMEREITAAFEDRKEIPSLTTIKWFDDTFERIVERIDFAFTELPFLYRDGMTLEYLVNKNEDDKLLKEIWNTLLRNIRHLYFNRIDIPSVAINYDNCPVCIAPPKRERNLPVASGVDRGATDGHQLVTPGAVLVEDNTVIVADK